MNPAPLHPALVHLPLALAVLAPLVAIALLFLWWRGRLSKRGWIAAIVLQAVLVGSAFVALQTGEREEERVEHVVGEAPIEAHEEAAQALLWGSGVVLGLMLVPLVVRREALAHWSATAGVAGSLLVAGLAVNTGKSGGALVYQHGAASAYGQTSAGVAPASDDDD